MNTTEQCAAFGQMVALMRIDSAQGEKIGSEDLEAVLLGVRRDA